MAIEFVCPTCGGTLSVGDDAAGRVIRCGGCMTALRVPVPAPPAPPPPPPPAAPHAAPASPFETDPPLPSPRRSSDRTPTDVDPLPEDEASLPAARRVERRRRPRRGPPPAAGRGVFFWLVVISSVAVFSMVVCCGGFFLFVPVNPKWRDHESENGKFKVQMPGDVRPDVEHAAFLMLEDGEKSEGALLYVRGQQFFVIYTDIPSTKDRAAKKARPDKEKPEKRKDDGEKPDRGNADEALIDEVIEKLLKAPGAKLIENKDKDKPLTVGGFPAREVEVRTQLGVYVVRVIVADTRMYTIIVHGGKRPPDADVRKFIDSFAITDPKLVAEGKRREQEQGEAEARDLRRAAKAAAEAALSAVP